MKNKLLVFGFVAVVAAGVWLPGASYAQTAANNFGITPGMSDQQIITILVQVVQSLMQQIQAIIAQRSIGGTATPTPVNPPTGTSIAVTYPTAGAVFNAGGQISVTLTNFNVGAQYDIYLIGKAYSYYFGTVTAQNTGQAQVSFTSFFALPGALQTDDQYQIKVVPVQGKGGSEGTPVYSSYFTIAVATSTQQAPTVSYISPSSASAGATIDVYGSNFDSATFIGFDGNSGTAIQPSAITLISPSELSFVVPQSLSTGAHYIAVAEKAGSWPLSSPVIFTVNPGGAIGVACIGPTADVIENALGNPNGTGPYEQLGLDTSAHPEILKYRLQWFGGNWSDWYVPGVNDVDNMKTNIDGTQRRMWAYFDDHTHEYIKCLTTSTSTVTTPVITGVAGPQQLTVGQTGTWAVNAYDPSGGNLSYSVNWGEAQACPVGAYCISPQSVQQTATFTHVYNSAGNYNPTFTVTNSAGKTAQTSLTVNVSATPQLSITVTYPQSGTILDNSGGKSSGLIANIQWTYSGMNSGSVNINLLNTSGQVVKQIASNIPILMANPSNGSYAWQYDSSIPNGNYSIAIMAYPSTGGEETFFSGIFTLTGNGNSTQPSIAVLSPAGGENLVQGQQYTTRWSSQNLPSNATIGLTIFNSGSVNSTGGIMGPNHSIASGISASAGSYAWTVEPNDGSWGVGLNNSWTNKLLGLLINKANAYGQWGNQYIIGISAVVNGSEAAWGHSNVFTINPAVAIPATPAAPTLSAIGPTLVSVAWPSVSGASTYHISRNPPNLDIGTVTGPAFTDDGSNSAVSNAMTCGTTYQYRIEACNSSNQCSAWGPWASVTIAACPAPVATTTIVTVSKPMKTLPFGPYPVCSDSSSMNQYCVENGYAGGTAGSAYSGGACAQYASGSWGP